MKVVYAFENMKTGKKNIFISFRFFAESRNVPVDMDGRNFTVIVGREKAGLENCFDLFHKDGVLYYKNNVDVLMRINEMYNISMINAKLDKIYKLENGKLKSINREDAVNELKKCHSEGKEVKVIL